MRLQLFCNLLDLNQALERALADLRRMEANPLFHREEVRYMRAEIESVRVHANREFFDRFDEIVEKDAQWAYKFRRVYEKKIQDPFDLYLEIKEREEERGRKGLPPRVVVLPGWDVGDDERIDVRQPKKPKRRSANRKLGRTWKQVSNTSRILGPDRKATNPEEGPTDA